MSVQVYIDWGTHQETNSQIPSELIRLLLEWKLSEHTEPILQSDGLLFEGQFARRNIRFSIKANGSFDIERMERLCDLNNGLEIELVENHDRIWVHWEREHWQPFQCIRVLGGSCYWQHCMIKKTGVTLLPFKIENDHMQQLWDRGFCSEVGP